MAQYMKTEADVLISEHPSSNPEFSSVAKKNTPVSRLRKQHFFSGWRKGVALGIFAAAFALVLNVLATVVFVVRYGNENGFSTLFTGACDQASHVNFGIHLVINVLGTLLLASSNYCMQVLTSPTRAEVDAAHARGKFVDIGLHSARNLGKIRKWRLWMWLLLLFSSLPLHLIYNSVVFSTVHAYEYTAVLASPGFVGGPTYTGPINVDTSNEVIGNSPSLADVQNVQANAPTFQRLDNADCIAAYHKALVTDRSDLVLVTMHHNASDQESNVFWTIRDGDFYVDFSGLASWISLTYNDTESNRLQATGDLPDPSTWQVKAWPIDHCLSRQEPETCTVQSSIYLTAVVIICNVLKIGGLLVTLLTHKEEPLVTIGDAIDSFMSSPDPNTENCCLLSRNDVKSGKFARGAARTKAFKMKRKFRFQAVSGARWWFSLLACVLGIAVIAVFLDLSIIAVDQSSLFPTQDEGHLTISQLWSLGFGLGGGTLFWQYAPPSLYGNIVFANLPQLIFSVLYFVYNGMYTVMSLAAEWTSYARRRKALRVSRPTGAQRSTYYLQLPYAYAVPLIVASAAMHWLISQSFYVLAVDFSGHAAAEVHSYASCGYSPIAIVFALALAGLMVAMVFVSGFRIVSFGMPVVGSCSLAISAACHPPPTGADPTAPLQWGAVEEDRGHVGVGHCAFSCDDVSQPVAGAQYSGRNGAVGG